MCTESTDNETWLIEVGDEIIEKKASSGYEKLSMLERSIYCLWVLDYAVRNSGGLGQIEDLHSSALVELLSSAESQNWKRVESLVSGSENEPEFCEKYYEQFDLACNELRSQYEST